MVSYGTLQHNITMGREWNVCDHGGKPVVGFSWLPQYHDMGLIGATIVSFASGWTVHLMSPLSFIKNPLLWVELMSRHKVTASFCLVVRKFRKAKESMKSPDGKSPVPGLDLSWIVSLFSGAEPIRPDTIQQFQDTFTQFGLPRTWFGAGYGRAEHALSDTSQAEEICSYSGSRHTS